MEIADRIQRNSAKEFVWQSWWILFEKQLWVPIHLEKTQFSVYVLNFCEIMKDRQRALEWVMAAL